MRATSIPNHERVFFETGEDALGKSFQISQQSLIVPGERRKLPYFFCQRSNGDQSYFYPDETPKTQIVLHFTAGYLRGDVATLTQPDFHVSVPFIIARSGAIVNLWSSRFWSYHLGPGAVGGNTEMSKQTIAIELSNIGYLRPIGDDLVTLYSNKDVYCSRRERRFYTALKTPYRGETHFASFSDEQYKSLIRLLRYLCATHQIPAEILPEAKRFETFTLQEAQRYRGIASHVNYRPNGKWDIGPAFDWDRLQRGLKS
jgi:N-acetylmuramoyl-L-alanine amidase